MEYSTQTQVFMAKYNLSFPDLIFCTLLAAGMDPGDAHYYVYNAKDKKRYSHDQQTANAREILKLNPGFSLLINEIKRNQYKQTGTTTTTQDQDITEEEKTRFQTRSGLIEEMIKSLRTIGGKDSVQVIQSLAKIQGLDKPDGDEGQERRRYVLRWLSHCRSCKLMKLFLEVEQNAR